jgi:hypothetical protein
MVKMLEQRQKEHYVNLGVPFPYGRNEEAATASASPSGEEKDEEEEEFVPRPRQYARP